MSCTQGREHTLYAVQTTRDVSDIGVEYLADTLGGAEDWAQAQAGAYPQETRRPGRSQVCVLIFVNYLILSPSGPASVTASNDQQGRQPRDK